MVFHLIYPPNPSESKCYDPGFSADTEAKVDGQLELYLRLGTFFYFPLVLSLFFTSFFTTFIHSFPSNTSMYLCVCTKRKYKIM